MLNVNNHGYHGDTREECKLVTSILFIQQETLYIWDGERTTSSGRDGWRFHGLSLVTSENKDHDVYIYILDILDVNR